jgi:hypothetical protein
MDWTKGGREGGTSTLNAVRLCGVHLEGVRTRQGGNWTDDIPDGNDRSIDAVRYAMNDVLRG